MTDPWEIRDGAVVEQPRAVSRHPLLSRIYTHHDDLIAQHLPEGRVLEVAFGKHMHPKATVGVEAWAENTREASRPAVLGDGRELPFRDGTFDAVVGRRFLHHVSPADRQRLIAEAARVLRPGGRIVLLEGTPGLYRRLTKGLAFRLGVLGEDNDVYGHCTPEEIRTLVEPTFEIVEERSLGSPLMPFSVLTTEMARRLFPLYRWTQFVRWWTFIVGKVTPRE